MNSVNYFLIILPASVSMAVKEAVAIEFYAARKYEEKFTMLRNRPLQNVISRKGKK